MRRNNRWAARLLGLALCAALLTGAAGCGSGEQEETGGETAFSAQPLSEEAREQQLHAAVLYDGTDNDGSWEDVLSRLDQAVVLGFDAAAVDVSRGLDLSGYDAVYPDESLLDRPELAREIEDFVYAGGAAFLTNGFAEYFSLDFLGAESLVEIEGCPAESLTVLEVGADWQGIGEIVADFASLYKDYGNYDTLAGYDYGWGIVPSTATALVMSGDTALYALNHWGKGVVLLTNPLLPNPYAVTGFAMESRSEEQEVFANSSATCNQLMENEFMAGLMREREGYSLSRVYGSYGRPNMSWELHYEEITGFENEASTIFGEAAKEYLQVPSYTLVRNTYWWFLRAESVTYLLGNEDEPFSYDIDFYEGAYSSGTHVAAGDEWLCLARVEDGGSYFVDYPEYDQRAYPYVGDLNGDGVLDILCGSADGALYFYEGTGFTERMTTNEAVPVTNAAGEALSVGSYSAPVAADVDGDGTADLVCGAGDGNVVWFSGNGDGTYESEGSLGIAPMDSQALPDVGDLNGDGCLDLVVGSNSGAIKVWYGASTSGLVVSGSGAALSVSEEDAGGTWLSPRMVDWNGDGAMDLAVGTFQGYILKLLNRNGSFVSDGYLETGERNMKGNNAIRFANNCVPCFADVNGDGITDLVVGSLEYGLAYPIDSEYLPESAREGLKASLAYMKENEFYVGAHFYTNTGASEEREAYELAAHQAAFEDYGLSWDGIGGNRHTWYASAFSHDQSLLSQWNSGLLWDSGFSPANAVDGTPQVAPENAIVYPFFLQEDGEDTLLVQNCSTVLYMDDTYGLLSGKYEMPVCLFYHMDFCYEPQNEAATEKNLQKAETYRQKFDYNFVREDQLMKASAAAIHLEVDAVPGADGGFTLTPYTDGETYALQDEHFANACGLKITFGSALAGQAFTTDADVWYQAADGSLYVGLNRPVTITEQTSGGEETPHLKQVNVPADITMTEDGAELAFHEGGMMQVTVSGTVSTPSEGWTITRSGRDTVFTKYGSADTLTLHFWAD